jgi:hypothetical protein
MKDNAKFAEKVNQQAGVLTEKILREFEYLKKAVKEYEVVSKKPMFSKKTGEWLVKMKPLKEGSEVWTPYIPKEGKFDISKSMGNAYVKAKGGTMRRIKDLPKRATKEVAEEAGKKVTKEGARKLLKGLSKAGKVGAIAGLGAVVVGGPGVATYRYAEKKRKQKLGRENY